jgi:hypothetical protein
MELRGGSRGEFLFTARTGVRAFSIFYQFRRKFGST